MRAIATSGTTFSATPALDPRRGHDLRERQAVVDVLRGGHVGELGDAAGEPMDRVVRQPRSRRVAADAAERPRRVDVAEAPRVDGVGRRLEHHRERRVAQRRVALQQRRERAVAERQLLAREEDEAERRRRTARARPSPRGRPSCPRSRARGRRRPRCARAGCPAREPCPGARRAAPRAAPSTAVPATTQPSPASRTGTPPARSTSATCAPSVASSWDSEGMSTSSSVLAARRSASTAGAYSSPVRVAPWIRPINDP